jgi:hypothetical protein
VIFIDVGTQAVVDSPISVKTVELHRDSDEIGVLSAQEKKEGKLACFNQRPFLVYYQHGQ